MDFPILSKKIRKAQLLVFFDLEATQIRHQAIAFALTAYKKEKDQLVFDDKDPINYFSYIRTDDVIGPIVQEMTGITKDTLIEKGKSIHEVILEISKLLRHYKDRCFISYGSMDIEILNQSIDHNNETEENFLRNITKNYFNFQQYLYQRIVDKNGNAFSIHKFAEKYNIKEDGRKHDPFYDSLVLKDTYLSYIKEKEKTMSFIFENYSHNKAMTSINKALAMKVLQEGKADKDDLIHLLEEYL